MTRNPKFQPAQRVAALCVALATIALLLGGCAADSRTVRVASENHNSRINIIVIHHTTADFGDSLNILTRPSSNSVSSHYLIPEPGDPSYDGDDLKVYELVPEERRAWHAGRSYWGGKTALNDQSIGIELVNQTYCHQRANGALAETASDEQRRICFFPDFAESQIRLLTDLLGELLERYPDVKPTQIVGHSDIAPSRKIDPGPRFPWERLYKLGYGAWFDDATVIRYWEMFSDQPVPLATVQRALQTYGYGIEPTGILDEQTRDVLRAFQMHFRPATVTGEPSTATVAILFALIEKYYPDALEALLEFDPVVADPLPAEVPTHDDTL